MKCVSALSTVQDSRAALQEVLGRAAGAFEEDPADLALVFASMHHADALGEIAAEVTRRGLGTHVLGCTGESIAGEDREIEEGPALGLWMLRAPGVSVRPRRVTFADGAFEGWPELEADPSDRPPRAAVERKPTLFLLADPFSFPTDVFLKRLHETEPGMQVIGGMASGSNAPAQNRLVLDGEVVSEGAVAVELDGPLTVRSVVSQGCRPVGRTAIVTRVDGNVIRELGRRPALEVLREVFEGLPEEDQERVQQGLHIGRVINEYQEKFRRGDFLVRNVIGADESGGIAIADVVRVGADGPVPRPGRGGDRGRGPPQPPEPGATDPTRDQDRRGPALHLQRSRLAPLSRARPRRRHHPRRPGGDPRRRVLRHGRDRPHRRPELRSRIHREPRPV